MDQSVSALLKNMPLDVVLPGLSSITVNQPTQQTVTADLPPSYDFLELDFLMEGVVPSNIDELRIMCNGAPQIRVPGTVLNAQINAYFGVPAFGADSGGGTANKFTLFLRRLGIKSGSGAAGSGVKLPWAKDLAYETSINAGVLDANGQGIRNLRIEIDLSDTPNTPCSIQVRGRCLPQDKTRGGAGAVPRIDRQSVTVSANQAVNLARPLLQFGDPLHDILFGILLVPASGTLDNFIFRYNGVTWITRTAANNAAIQAQDNVRFPQSGGYWVDFTERGFGDEFLPIGDVGTDIQLQFTPSASGSIDVYQFGVSRIVG